VFVFDQVRHPQPLPHLCHSVVASQHHTFILQSHCLSKAGKAMHIHEMYQYRLLYLLHSEDSPQDKLDRCRPWLNSLSQYPSLAAAIYPTFAGCCDALQAIVAARPKRPFIYRTTNIALSKEYQRKVEQRLAEARQKRQ
jgi:hypothetical protein